MLPGYPENCIASCEKTLSLLPAFFEIDFSFTKDSVMVLMHDLTLDRTTTGKGRVAAGMLTYAKGDYPVLGNDGRVYNATYQRELKTGVYGGGAHFGIFSERKPEMIVDGNTTQQLILNYPHIYESILTIARHGRLSSAMPTYAAGSYPSAPASVQAGGTGGGPAQDDTRMRETLSGLQNAVAALTERLSRPISATVDPYGRKGAVNQLDKASRFMKKRGLQND